MQLMCLQEEGWVVCRVFMKRMTTVRKVVEYESPCWYDEAASFMQEFDRHSPSTRINNHHNHISPSPYYACKQEFEVQYNMNNLPHHDPFLQLPQLESPNNNHKLPNTTIFTTNITTFDHHHHRNTTNTMSFYDQPVVMDDDQVVTDWRVFDKFVASQLSHEIHQQHASKETINADVVADATNEQVTIMMENQSTVRSTSELEQEYASTSTTTTCNIELWK